MSTTTATPRPLEIHDTFVTCGGTDGCNGIICRPTCWPIRTGVGRCAALTATEAIGGPSPNEFELARVNLFPPRTSSGVAASGPIVGGAIGSDRTSSMWPMRAVETDRSVCGRRHLRRLPVMASLWTTRASGRRRSNAGSPEGNLQVCLERKRAQTRSLEPGRSGDPIRRSGSATTTAKHPERRERRRSRPVRDRKPSQFLRRDIRRLAAGRAHPDRAPATRSAGRHPEPAHPMMSGYQGVRVTRGWQVPGNTMGYTTTSQASSGRRC